MMTKVTGLEIKLFQDDIEALLGFLEQYLYEAVQKYETREQFDGHYSKVLYIFKRLCYNTGRMSTVEFLDEYIESELD